MTLRQLQHLAAVIVTIVGATADAQTGGYSFTSPFDRSQCDLARGYAIKLAAKAPSAGQRVLAEAYLCKALDSGNAWILEQAISQLRRLTVLSPADVYLQAELTEALVMRVPLADSTLEAVRRVSGQLLTADVGAAREALRRRFEQHIEAIKAHECNLWKLLGVGEPTGDRVPLPMLMHFPDLLLLTGNSGLASALHSLGEEGLAREPLWRTYEAESMLMAGDLNVARSLYEQIAGSACDLGSGRADNPCRLVRRRLEELKEASKSGWL